MKDAAISLLATEATHAALDRGLGRIAPSLLRASPREAARTKAGQVTLFVSGDDLRDADRLAELTRKIGIKRRAGETRAVVLVEARSDEPMKAQGRLQLLSELVGKAWKRDVDPMLADAQTTKRILRAMESGAPERCIVRARVVDGQLLVWDGTLRGHRVPVASIAALEEMTSAQLEALEVSESGSRIHWASHDVDINLDTVRASVDPAFRKKQEAIARTEAVAYAGAIRALRLKKGLKQSEMGGLDEREVRRLERSEVIPRMASLRKLADAHGMAVNDYLRELGQLAASAKARGPGAARKLPAKAKARSGEERKTRRVVPRRA